ncbi:MAG: hypothetical protein GX640_15820, partial [Fibrobacter sp.]|nr:hypothetical protein [Fibrobacter sp.]
MISIDQLKPCDILMCQGNSFISEMIIALDKGGYSHAAFYYGDGYVNHATKDGILHQKLQDSLMLSEKHIDVYRFKKGVFGIGDQGWPAAPLLSVADYYTINHTAFAWDELLLLGFLSLTRDIDLPPQMAAKLRKLLDSEAAKILEHFRDGKSMMICSEFVYHC